ncbi:hypothetical protein C2G38_2180214 [Gigaspora rosea]|uniref:Uncharacterized protein n=1 Tax=Gigaspora rosea TaxID=44941 RepID=A0A397VJI2_9GLOM|nr:hypothetical protein C2G38_2180214 [Gigaspora rosea]
MSCDYETLIDQFNLIESSIFGCKSIFRTRSLKNWFTFKLKYLDKLLINVGSQLRTIGEVVRPKGTYGTILELQNMLKKNFESISEPDDLFSDEENTIMNENFSPIALEYYLDLDVAYIFDLIRCEMIAKGLPQRTNLERDIDVFIKRYIFSCFDDILDIHFTTTMSINHLTRYDKFLKVFINDYQNVINSDIQKHGREFSLCEHAGSKIEYTKEVLTNTLKMQKTLRDMHKTLVKVENRGYLDKYELDTTMAKTIAAILADFDIPTKYEELGSVIKISCIMLQIKKLLSTTISRYNRIKSKAKNEKFTSGRVPMFSGQQEHQ